MDPVVSLKYQTEVELLFGTAVIQQHQFGPTLPPHPFMNTCEQARLQHRGLRPLLIKYEV